MKNYTVGFKEDASNPEVMYSDGVMMMISIGIQGEFR